MSDKEILVKLGADVSALRSGMDAGTASISSGIQRITGLFQKMAADTAKATQDTAEATKGMAGQLSGAFDSLAGVAGRFNTVILGVTAVLAGGAIFKESVAATMEFTGEANKLARVMGITQTEASNLAIALGDVYSSTDDMAGAAAMLSRQIRTNEDAVKKMGLETRNADGSLRNMKDLMLDAIKTVNEYKQGTDRAMAAQVLFGRGASDLAGMLNLTKERLEEAAAKQKALGLIVGVESVAAAKAYKAAMNDAGDVLLALKKVIGDALIPILTKFAQWFSNIGPAAVSILKVAIGSIVTAFWTLHGIVNTLWQLIDSMVYSVAEPLMSLGKGLMKMVNRDFKGAVDEIAGMPGRIVDKWGAAGNDIAETAKKDAERIKQAFSDDTPITANGKGKGGKQYNDPNAGKTGSDTRFEKMRQQFQDEIQLQKAFNDTSLSLEILFWEQKLETVKGGTAADKKLRYQINQELYNLKKQEYAQNAALSMESISASARFAQMEIAQEEARVKEMKAKGTLSLKEALELEKQSAMQRYYVKADALAKENVLAQGNLLAQKKIANEQKAIAMDYLRELESLQVNYENEVLADKIAAMRREAELAGNNLQLRLNIAQQIYNEVRKLYAAESREAQEAAAEVGRVERQLLDQKRRMAQEEIDLREKVAQKIVDIALGAAQLERDLGMSTGVELLKRTAAMEEERFAIQKKAAEERIALIDPLGDPEAYNKAYAAKEELAAAHAQKMIEINRNITRETNADLVGAFQNIGQGLSSALQDLMKGTTNFKQFMLNIMQTITNAFFKMFADIIAREIMTGIQRRVFEKTVATSRITAQAALAGASGVASMAGAPFPMNLSAPEFGAAMSSLAGSYSGMLAAEQGFDVPAGMSPVTRLHEKEMVLPAQYADVIRSLSERGGAAAGATNVKLEVHPDAIRMTLGDWLQGELARQAAMR